MEEHGFRVFENRLLRAIFEPKRQKKAEGCKRLYNEKFHDLHASPEIIRVIKSRKMGWAGCIALMREMRNRKKKKLKA
jgi:hypothetical protein